MTKNSSGNKKEPSFTTQKESNNHSWDNERDAFFLEPKDSTGDAFKIGLAVFIAIVSAFIAREMYEQYQARKFAQELIRQASSFQSEMASMSARTQARINAENERNQARLRGLEQQRKARQLEVERQDYLNHYWENVGNGTFINRGRTQRNGDLATAVIKVNNREQRLDINCVDRSFWSEVNKGWFLVLDPYSTEYKLVTIACNK